MTALPSAAEVVAFWRGAGRAKWFAKDASFDAAIRTRFLALHEVAARGECDAWAATPEGALALVILLDQFPRNLFRASPRAFATDTRALSVAAGAVSDGFDRRVPFEMRVFVYMPFMHSEKLVDQEHGVALFGALGEPDGLRAAREHRDIIARFGRFPHRNLVLGRPMTPDERLFLDAGGFSG